VNIKHLLYIKYHKIKRFLFFITYGIKLSSKIVRKRNCFLCERQI